MRCVAVVPVPVGEKEADDKDGNSEAPSSLSESNSVKSRKEEERNNSIKKVAEDRLWKSAIPLGTVNACKLSKIRFKDRCKLQDIKYWNKCFNARAARSLKMKSQKYPKQQMPQTSQRPPTRTITRRYSKAEQFIEPWICWGKTKRRSLFGPVHVPEFSQRSPFPCRVERRRKNLKRLS